MRYLFPIAPFLCITAVWAASRLPQFEIWGAALALIVVAALPGILQPFAAVDPRDLAAQIIKDDGRNPVALVNNPWFYTPPFQPVGLNVPVDGTIVVGLDAQKLMDIKTPIFTVSEFETREARRLGTNITEAGFTDVLPDVHLPHREYHFPNGFSLALPGRQFVPHDYLYPNPKTSVYLRKTQP